MDYKQYVSQTFLACLFERYETNEDKLYATQVYARLNQRWKHANKEPIKLRLFFEALQPYMLEKPLEDSVVDKMFPLNLN